MKTFLTLLTLAFAGTLLAQNRVALVIGNNAYTSFPEAKQLTSPRADAADVADKLRAIGFTVLAPVLDGTREAIVKAKNEFLIQAKDAQIALFYFSGHGFQVGEENFLIPSDMPRITSYTVLKDNALMLRDSLMVGLEEAGAQTKVIILDCCRDNPFAAQLERALSGNNKSLRTKGGTGEISGYGPGFYLAFATSPGTVADDGNGQRNSPFTSALITHLKDKAGENIRDLFDEVKETVREKSGEEQVPWTNDSLSKSHVKVLAKLAPDRPSSPPPAIAKDGALPMPKLPSSGSQPALSLDEGAVGKVIQITLPGGVPMKFCYCPPGNFTMGSPASEEGRGEDEGQVQVRISKGFWMAQTECTQGQWQAVMRTSIQEQAKLGGDSLSGTGAEFPMYDVSHEEATSFCEIVQGSVILPAGWKVALPSEAQWEYACRAGTTGAFAGTLHKVAWNGDNSGSTANAVAGKQANAWGLYDMHGNVWEWCSDWYDSKLLGGTDPHGVATGVIRVLRGGSWYYVAARCRAALRFSDGPGNRGHDLGFRPALVPSK